MATDVLPTSDEELGALAEKAEAGGFVGTEATAALIAEKEAEAATEEAELEPILTETQAARLKKLEADRDELQSIVTDLEAAEKAQSRVVDRTSPGKKREAAFKDWQKVQKQVNAEKTRLNKVLEDIAKVRESGLDKARKRQEIDDRKKAKEEEKALATAPKYDDFVCRVLTDTEKEERTRLETEAFALMEDVKRGSMAFAAKVQEIVDKGLYVDHPGGKFQYIQDTFGIGKNQFNRTGVQLNVLGNLVEIKALPPKPDEGIDLSDFDPASMPERQARELNRAGGKEEQAKVLTAVLKDAKEKAVPVTADNIRAVVEHLRTEKEVLTPTEIIEKRKEKKAAKVTPTGVSEAPAPSVLSSSILGQPDEALSIWRNFGHEYTLKAANVTIDGVPARRFTVAIDGTYVGTEFQNAIAAKEHLELVAKAHKSEFQKATNWPEDNEADAEGSTATADAAVVGTGDAPVVEGATEAGPGRNGAHPKPLANGEDGNEYYIGMDNGKPEVYAHNPVTDGAFEIGKTGYSEVEGPFTQAEAHARFKAINKERRQKAAAA